MPPTCLRHAAPAVYECDGCHQPLCDACVTEGKFLTICRLCGERAFPFGEDPLAEARAELARADLARTETSLAAAPTAAAPAPRAFPAAAPLEEAGGTVYREPSDLAETDFPGAGGAALALAHHVVVPAAVIAMVASLLFYLVDLRTVFFANGAALKWLFFWFTCATVLIGRYAKSGDKSRQGLYSAALTLATGLVLVAAPWDRGGGAPGGRLLDGAILAIAWWYARSLTTALAADNEPPRSPAAARLYGVERLRHEAWEKEQDPLKLPRRREAAPAAADAHGNPSRAVARLAVPALVGIALGEPLLLAGPPEAGIAALAALIVFLLATAVLLAAGSALGTLRYARARGGKVEEGLLAPRLALAAGLMVALLAVAIGMPGIRYQGKGTSPAATAAGASGAPEDKGDAAGESTEAAEAGDELEPTNQAEPESGAADGAQASGKQADYHDPGHAEELAAAEKPREPEAPDAATRLVGLVETLGRWLRWPALAAAALAGLWSLWKIGPQLGWAQKSLWGRLAAFLASLLGRFRGRRPEARRDRKQRPTERPWAKLEALNALPPRAAVLEAYRRFLLACAEQGHPHRDDATPDEWLQDLPRELAPWRPPAEKLTELYVQAAYAADEVAPEQKDRALRLLAALRAARSSSW